MKFQPVARSVLPARSRIDDASRTRYVCLAASVALGLRVARWVLASYVTTAARIAPVVESRRRTLVVVSVEARIASANVTLMLAVLDAPVAPAVGVLAETVGRRLSVVTVNDHDAPANAFPARSWMPVPADTVK